MLHERIRHQNEIPREPATECNRDGSGKMPARSEPFLAEDQGADERALQEEREHAFHGQRLANDTAGILRKVGPVRSELEFHRNPRDHTDGKIKSEYLGPKPDGLV